MHETLDLITGPNRTELADAVRRVENRCELTGEPVTAATAVYIEGDSGTRTVLGDVWDGWRTLVEAFTGRPDAVLDGRELFPLL